MAVSRPFGEADLADQFGFQPGAAAHLRAAESASIGTLRREVSEGAVGADYFFELCMKRSQNLSAFKVSILDRMVFYLHRQAPITAPGGKTFRDSPGFQHAVHFEAKIVVKASGGMLLHNKRRLFLSCRGVDSPGGLLRALEVPLGFVFFEHVVTM